MCPSNLPQRLLSRLKSQMIGIVQTEITPGPSQLFRRKSLERGLGRNRHEHGQRYGAMGKCQDGGAGFCGLFMEILSPISIWGK